MSYQRVESPELEVIEYDVRRFPERDAEEGDDQPKEGRLGELLAE